MAMGKAFEALKMPASPRSLMKRADSHGREELNGGIGSALTGLVDLGRRHRLGIGQRTVLDHHPPKDGHEQDAEDAAHDHQGRRRQVLREVQRLELPHPEDHEGRNREDGSSGHRLADGADGARVVLFEDRTPSATRSTAMPMTAAG